MTDVNWPKPWARQREVLYLPTTGVSVVQGAAGSGKTLMALYRAKYLSDPSFAHSGPTLLLTYNRPLADYLSNLVGEPIKVATYHQFVYQVLPPREELNIERKYPLEMCQNDSRTDLIKAAVDKVKESKDENPLFSYSTDFFVDEINWLLRMGTCSLEEYESPAIRRYDERLTAEQREIMYEIFDVYLQELEQAPYDYEFEQMPYVWANSSYCKSSLAPYKHIIIDEGQDFPPVFVNAIIQSLKVDSSLTFFVDNTQQVFGPRICFNSSFFKGARFWNLYENYRSTVEIYELAKAISDKISSLGHSDDVLRSEPPTVRGHRPQLLKLKDNATRDKVIAKLGENDFSKISCAFLVNTNEEMNHIKSLVPNAINLRSHLSKGRKLDSGAYYSTYQLAKGLDFDCVVLPFVDANDYVSLAQAASSPFAKDDTIKALKALYVSVTRARYTVVMLFVDSLSDLIPHHHSLYELNQDAKTYFAEHNTSSS